MRRRRLLATITVALVSLAALAPGAGAKSTPADVQRGLERLVAAPGGPPGALFSHEPSPSAGFERSTGQSLLGCF